MKFLLFGHKGWIGKQLFELLKLNSDVEIITTDIRVDNYDEIEKFIINTKPDRIISVIGRTYGDNMNSIDYLEQKGNLKININDNLYSPLNLALISNKYNIHFTYMGTGCIFNGYEQEYTENDDPNFFGSSYSIVKGFTDKIIKKFDNTLNVRIRMPITNDITSNRNFINKIINYKKICSMNNSMTFLPDLLPLMIDMIIKKEIGTINLTNPDYISHNEILELYKEIINPDFKWENMTIEEQNKILLSERSNNILNTEKLQKLYPDIKDIKTSIKDLFLNYK
jgi:nucleoside-diphosphate-sugar epimerase